MKLQEFMNDDTCQILLAIIIGIVICYFIFGQSGSCNRRDGFSVGANTYMIPTNSLTEPQQFAGDVGVLDTNIDCGQPTGGKTALANIQNILNKACCNESGEDCSKTGFPSTCDPDCNTVMTTINTACINDPNYIFNSGMALEESNVALNNAIDLCRSSNLTPTPPPPPTPTPPTPTYNCSYSMDGLVKQLGQLDETCADLTTGVMTTCSDTCRQLFNPYYTACLQEINESAVSAQFNEINDKCNPTGGDALPTVTPQQPNVVGSSDITDIANNMVQLLTTGTDGVNKLNGNGLAQGISNTTEAYGEHIYPVVLHADNYDKKIVFGGHTDRNNITTVKLMVNGSMDPNEQYFGSIAQAVASIFKSQGETTAIEDEYTEFCGSGATYGGGDNARIDTDAKVISLPTYETHLSDGMCGMIGNEQIEGSYQDAVKTRLDGQFARNYINEIGISYVELDSRDVTIKLPVAETESSNIINVSSVQSDSLVHTVINFKNGVPSLTSSAVSDTANASGNDYLVIMTKGLSDAEAFETVRKTPLDGLRAIKELQYMVAQERHDTTEFVPLNYDPFSGIQCTGGICSLDDSVGTELANPECSFADPSVQSYGFVVVKLWSQESPTGYKYTTPDDLVTLKLQIRNGQIIHETDRTIAFESTGNFFLFIHSGIKYVVPNAPIGEEQRISDVLALPVCATGAQNPQCCAQIIEAGYLDTLIEAGQNDLFDYCIRQLEAPAGPPPATGGGASAGEETPSGQETCGSAQMILAGDLDTSNDCPDGLSVSSNMFGSNFTEGKFKQECCTKVCTGDHVERSDQYYLPGSTQNDCTALSNAPEIAPTQCNANPNYESNCCACHASQ